jgi:hypothetical protein
LELSIDYALNQSKDKISGVIDKNDAVLETMSPSGQK